MRTTASVSLLTLAVLLVTATGCGGTEPPAADSGAATAPAGPEATTETGGLGAAAPAASAPSAAAAGPAAVIAAQETNWPSIVAEVTELRRRGNTLTARVRLTNRGGEPSEADISYDEVYLMDADAGKKYEVLRDEQDRYIAGLRSGWDNRWYQTLEPGQAFTVWMKFPAPPPEVRAVTLQVPGMPPFEELPIQDS